MVKMNFSPFPELRTKRLLLRQLDFGDKNEIFSLYSDEKVLEFQDREAVKSIDEAIDFISRVKKGIYNNQWIFWTITLKGDSRLIGLIYLWDFSLEDASAHIGFELHPSYQGIGIMQEALPAVINYGCNVLLLQSLLAHTHSKNTKAIRLLEKSRFIKEESNHHSQDKIEYILKKI